MSQPGVSSLERRKVAGASEICAHFKKVLDAFKLYEPGHVALRGFMQGLNEKLDGYLREFEDLELEISSFTLSVEGKPAFTAEKREDAISHPMFLDGVQKLVFSPGLSLDEVETFMGIWQVSFHDGAASTRSFVTRFWEANLQSVRMTAIETFAEGSDAGGGDEELDKKEDNIKAVMSEITSGRLANLGTGDVAVAKVVRATKEDLALLRMDALADLQPDDLQRQDLRRESVPGLEQADAERLAGEMALLEHREPARAVLALARASQRASEQEFAEVEKLLADVFVALCKGRKFEELQRVLGRVAEFARADINEVERRSRVAMKVLESLGREDILALVAAGLDDAAVADPAMRVLHFALPGVVDALFRLIPQARTERGRQLLCRVIGDKRPSPGTFARHLVGLDAPVALQMLETAAKLSANHAKQARLAALGHPEAQVRRAAVRDFRREDAPSVVTQLRPLLGDPDEAVRRSALNLLVGIKDREIVANLEQLLGDRAVEGAERKTLIVALGTLGGAAAARALVKEFEQTRDAELRGACALAMGSTGEEAVRAALEQTAKKFLTSGELKKACLEGLRRLDARKGAQGVDA